MSTALFTASSRQESTTARLRKLLIGASFTLVLLMRKLFRIRQSPSSWFVFRTLLGLSGVALVLLPLTLSSNWIAAPAGLCMFLASILLGPAKPCTTCADKARELGAFAVVNGGAYQSGEAAPASVQLYVGVESISVLDARFQPLLVIPVGQITSAAAILQGHHWTLHIRWSDETSEFFYRGIFAGHLARVAESAVISVVPSPRPILQRSRAAGA